MAAGTSHGAVVVPPLAGALIAAIALPAKEQDGKATPRPRLQLHMVAGPSVTPQAAAHATPGVYRRKGGACPPVGAHSINHNSGGLSGGH